MNPRGKGRKDELRCATYVIHMMTWTNSVQIDVAYRTEGGLNPRGKGRKDE